MKKFPETETWIGSETLLTGQSAETASGTDAASWATICWYEASSGRDCTVQLVLYSTIIRTLQWFGFSSEFTTIHQWIYNYRMTRFSIPSRLIKFSKSIPIYHLILFGHFIFYLLTTQVVQWLLHQRIWTIHCQVVKAEGKSWAVQSNTLKKLCMINSHSITAVIQV